MQKTIFRLLWYYKRRKHKTETVCLRFEIKQAQFIRSLPLHSTQKEISQTDQTVDFEFYLRPTYDFVQEILKYGSLWKL